MSSFLLSRYILLSIISKDRCSEGSSRCNMFSYRWWWKSRIAAVASWWFCRMSEVFQLYLVLCLRSAHKLYSNAMLVNKKRKTWNSCMFPLCHSFTHGWHLAAWYRMIRICQYPCAKLFQFVADCSFSKNLSNWRTTLTYTHAFSVFFCYIYREEFQMICIKSFFLETSVTKGHFDETQTLVFVCFFGYKIDCLSVSDFQVRVTEFVCGHPFKTHGTL